MLMAVGTSFVRVQALSSTDRFPHIVQLFDSEESRARVVAAYLLEGLACGETLLAVMLPENWKRTARRLQDSGVSVRTAIDRGRLTVLDAEESLAECTLNDWPVEERLDRSAGALVRELRRRGPALRVYGEMVDLLARDGNFRSAQRMESLWHELASREPFTLFCGYSSVHFGHPSSLGALKSICATHTRVESEPRDLLAHWLTEGATRGTSLAGNPGPGGSKTSNVRP